MRQFLKKYIRPAIVFFVGLVTFDLLTMEQPIRSIIVIMNISNFRRVLFFEELIAIAIPYFTLLTVLSILLVWISSALKVKKIKTFYCLIFAYILGLATIRFPQIVYGIGFSEYFPSNVDFLGRPLLIFVSVLLSLLCLWQGRKSVLQDQRPLSRLNSKMATLLPIVFMIYNVVCLSEENYGGSAQSDLSFSPKKNIIVISVDSLNADADDIVRKYANPALREFLDTSVKTENVIADVTQTHGSFASLFSGRPPFETAFRYPYSESIADPQQDSFETLKTLKNAGYGIKIIRDEMVTAPLFSGSVIDKVYSPQEEERSNTLGLIFSSVVVYGVFDNFIGRIFFSEAYDNSSFAYAKGSARTLKDFEQVLKENQLGSKQELIFFHSCLLHSPLKLPYPYYPETAFNEGEYKRFSYPESYLKVIEVPEHAQLMSGAAYNQTIYEQGVRMLVERMLNPLFEKLKQSGDLKNSTIILMSDHGENLWGKHKHLVGVNPIPFHGDTFLFGSHNEFSYFRHSQANTIETPSSNPINLSQMFRKVLGQKFQDHLVYSENAFIPQKPNLSMTNYLSYTAIVNFLQKSPHRNFYFADSKVILPAMLQKQRAVFAEHFKLVSYITDYGRRFFLCDLLEDSKCETNLFNEHQYSKIRTRLLSDLGTAIEADRLKELDVSINLLESPEALRDYFESSNPWLKAFGAFILYKRFHAFKESINLLKEIFFNTDDENLKQQIAQWAIDNCLYTDEQLRPFFQTLAQHRIENSPNIRVTLVNSRYFFCDTEGVASAEQRADIWMAAWQVDVIENMETLYNLPEGVQYIRNLEAKYKISAQRNITEVFLKIPKEFQRKEYERFTEFIKYHHKYFFAYDFPDDKNFYFYIKTMLSIRLSLENEWEILSELADNRASAVFEVRLFNYLEGRHSMKPLLVGSGLHDVRKMRLERLKHYLRPKGG